MSNTLLPCPFCGGEGCIQEHVFVGYTSTFGVVCLDCCAETRQFFNTKDEAIAAWNRRAGKDINVATNADRIRSMSDEELAKIITSDLIGELIPFCQNKYECDAMLTINTIPEEWCMKCALDWLKEEHNEAD